MRLLYRYIVLIGRLLWRDLRTSWLRLSMSQMCRTLPAPEKHTGDEGDGKKGHRPNVLHGLAPAVIDHGCRIGGR